MKRPDIYAKGTRVRLLAEPTGLVAPVLTGTIARHAWQSDGPIWDRFMVDLDAPAIFQHDDLAPVILGRVCVHQTGFVVEEV